MALLDMADPSTRPTRFTLAPVTLARLTLWALAARIVVVDVVQWITQWKDVLCLFPDANYYWLLATRLRRGETYEIVDFEAIPHFALRTPGYPLFLAACQFLLGPRAMPARLVQAILGAACVGLIWLLARRALPRDTRPRGWSVPLLAALIVAFEPYTVANSAFLLSEALFVPLLLLTQWGLATLWEPEDGTTGMRGPRWLGLALATGAGLGAAVLVRPAWWLYAPLALSGWVMLAGRGRRRAAVLGSVLVLVGLAVVMSPWWVRNARLYGRFVPTALWMGASLHDGLNPNATGASDMSFLADPDLWPLDEERQDAELTRRALAFARERPGRVAWLAVIKAGRFWSPWPNAGGFRGLALGIASAAITLPLFALLGIGAWDRRRDPRASSLLGLPLVYTFLMHLIFVGSARYRVPVMVPALGLAALGLRIVLDKFNPTDTRESVVTLPPGTEGSGRWLRDADTA